MLNFNHKGVSDSLFAFQNGSSACCNENSASTIFANSYKIDPTLTFVVRNEERGWKVSAKNEERVGDGPQLSTRLLLLG